ncbi:MAG: cell division protein FtsH, partial [Fibrobacter sp.]|nr:cell division protein FtsH [Fibrobacter sp.]
MSNKPKAPSAFHNRNFFLIATMLLMVLFFMRLYNDETSLDLTRTDFFAMMNDSTTEIKSLKLQRTLDGIMIEGSRAMTEEEIAETAKEQGLLSRIARRSPNSNQTVAFSSHVLDLTSSQIDAWEKNKGIKVRVQHETTSWIDRIFAFLPAILLIAFFWYMM